MPVTEASLTSDASAVAGTEFTTASITPSANQLILASINGTGTGAPTVTLAGNGLTWVEVATQTEGGNRRTSVFRAMGASPSSEAVTITWSASVNDCFWSIAEFDNVDTGGTNGSAAVVQSATNVGTNVTSLEVTLGAFGSADNATYGTFSTTSGPQEITPGTGFTEIHEVTAGARDHFSEWRNDNDTSVDASWTAAGTDPIGIAVEIKFASGAAAQTMGYIEHPVQLRPNITVPGIAR